jgi:hypothetical protein
MILAHRRNLQSHSSQTVLQVGNNITERGDGKSPPWVDKSVLIVTLKIPGCYNFANLEVIKQSAKPQFPKFAPSRNITERGNDKSPPWVDWCLSIVTLKISRCYSFAYLDVSKKIA